MSSKLLKWVAAAAGTMLIAGAVPALAAHISHRHLIAKKHTAHSLIATATPVSHLKAHALKATHLTAKARTLSAHRKHVLRTTAVHHKTTKLAVRHHKAVDKLSAMRSNG
jgi:hypothetical protein